VKLSRTSPNGNFHAIRLFDPAGAMLRAWEVPSANPNDTFVEQWADAYRGAMHAFASVPGARLGHAPPQRALLVDAGPAEHVPALAADRQVDGLRLAKLEEIILPMHLAAAAQRALSVRVSGAPGDVR